MKSNQLTREELEELSVRIFFASSKGNLEQLENLFAKLPNISALTKYGYSLDTPLHIASQNGHAEVVEFLIEKGLDVNIQNKDGVTPLYEACKNGHSNVIKILIKAGVDATNTLAKYEFLSYNTPLHIASVNNHPETIKILLEAGIDVDIIDSCGITPLHEACRFNKIQAIEELIKAGANVNLTNDDEGKTPLHFCSKNGDFRRIKKLIEAGADLNLTDKKGKTPLDYAILSGNIEAVKTLLSYGARHDQVTNLENFKFLDQDSIGEKIIQTLFDYGINVSTLCDALSTKYPILTDFISSLNNPESIARRDEELVKLNQKKEENISSVARFVEQKKAKEQQLINAINSGNTDEINRLVTQENVNINFFNESKQNPLLVALSNEELTKETKESVIKALLSLKASPNKSLFLAVTNDKANLIDDLLGLGGNIKMICGYGDLVQNAVVAESIKSIEKLNTLGFDLKKEYKDRKTLLHLASKNGKSKVVSFLIANNVQINAFDQKNETALHLASQNGHCETVRLLIANNSNISSWNENCEKPLHLASQTANYEVVKILIASGSDINAKDMISQTPLIFALNAFYTRKKEDIRETIKTLIFSGAELSKIDRERYVKKFIKFLKSITPQELDEIKSQHSIQEKIEQSGFYAILKIAKLECTDHFSEERKQNFLEKILSKKSPLPELKFLTFPPIINILESKKISSENKFQIIEAIANNPIQFQKSYQEFSKMKIAATHPIISSKSGGEISLENQTSILKILLPDNIRSLNFIEDSDNNKVLENLVEVLLERPHSSLKPNPTPTGSGTRVATNTTIPNQP